MNKSIRKTIVAVAALLSIAIVPAAAAGTDARGGFGEWPVDTTRA